MAMRKPHGDQHSFDDSAQPSSAATIPNSSASPGDAHSSGTPSGGYATAATAPCAGTGSRTGAPTSRGARAATASPTPFSGSVRTMRLPGPETNAD